MDTRLRLLAAACALVFVTGVVAAFTVDEGDDHEVASDTDSFGPGEAEDSDDVSADGSTTTTEADREVDDDRAESTESSAESGTDEATTTTAARTTTAPETTTTVAPTPDSPALLGVTPTAPGTYTYDVSGCCDEEGNELSGTSTLTVPAPDASGRQAQVQSGPEGASTTTYRFTPEGTYLESMSMASPAGSLEFRATAPILVIPAGAPAGSQARGRLTGSGVASNIRVDVHFTLIEVTDTQASAEIEATISGSAFGCDVDGTMNMQITARRGDQLPLDTRSQTDVSIDGLLCPMSTSMAGDARTTLRS